MRAGKRGPSSATVVPLVGSMHDDANSTTRHTSCPLGCNRSDDCASIGDGHCDVLPRPDAANTDVCGWDGGDCCIESCVGLGCDDEHLLANDYLCADPQYFDDLEIILTGSLAAAVLVVTGIVLAVVFLRQHMRKVIGREKDAKRIITLVEDTAYSIPFHHLKIGKLLAAGGAGQVYEGTFSGQPVAIKELFSVLFDPDFLKDLKAEAVRSCLWNVCCVCVHINLPASVDLPC